jgi:hypothetical protein
VSLNDGVDERKSQAVTGRLFSFYKALEGTSPDIGRKSRAVVENREFRRAFVSAEAQFHFATSWKMSQLVFEEIAECAIHQAKIGVNNDMVFQVEYQAVLPFGHRRLIDVS